LNTHLGIIIYKNRIFEVNKIGNRWTTGRMYRYNLAFLAIKLGAGGRICFMKGEDMAGTQYVVL
jgi:hypothetical protein